ncbi:MAG: rhodanese-like domain-containing protein [Filomicrobium sp.]
MGHRTETHRLIPAVDRDRHLPRRRSHKRAPNSFAAIALTILLTLYGGSLSTASAVEITGSNFDPTTGYRIKHYRAVLPDSVPGGATIDTEQVEKLFKAGNTIFLDVMPSTGAGFSPKTGKWRLTKKRENIPGSTWLPDVGRGKLQPALQHYFEDNLRELTGGNKSKQILIYCQSDCWMAWNAVRRASELGYQNIYWYPHGTDAWKDWDNPTVPATPVPVKIAATGNSSDTSTANNKTKPTSAPLAGTKTIYLIDGQGTPTEIGQVAFTNSGEKSAIDVKLQSKDFEEKFLSMRPFRCIDGTKQTVCHLPYPYQLEDKVTAKDLRDLEYRLLFLHKGPTDYGIDAWNGMYYRLKADASGKITGALHEADFNILAVPPEPGVTRPIGEADLQEAETERHRFPKIEIR